MTATEGNDQIARAQARVGQVLRGKYRLDRVLGAGGMAVVYVATHRNKKRFAVKMLHAELSLRPDLCSRFLREGYAANSVDHPGAVAVLDDDVAEDGSAFLVMELLEGESVEGRWERSGRRLHLATVLAIGHELLDVLQAAHAHGIIHRDIKPANLFLTVEGRVKVLDFGIARVRDTGTSHATQAGAIMGTPAFMAPEQALGRTADIDGQTDIWAVGATLFTLASGRVVHEGESGQLILIKAATQPAPSLGTVLTDAPSAFVRAIDGALAFHKAQRWRNAAAMREALDEASMAAFGRVPSLAPDPELGEAVPPLTPIVTPNGLRPVHESHAQAAPIGALRATTAPVSSERDAPAPEPTKQRRASGMLIGVGGTTAALVLAAAAVVARSHSGRQQSPDFSASTLSAQPIATLLSPRATADSAPIVDVPPIVAPSPSIAAPLVLPSPSNGPRRKPSAIESRVHKPDCNPNFTLDGQGEKHFRPECFPTHER